MKKLLSATLAAAAILLASHTEAFACSCVPPVPDKSLASAVGRARNFAEGVFSGTVTKITKNTEKEELTITFKVKKAWKGAIYRETNVVTGAHDGNCGYRFSKGTDYLVYASRSADNLLETDICHRTALLTNAVADLKILGKGKALLPGSSPPPAEPPIIGQHPPYIVERNKSTPFRYVLVMGVSEIERYVNESTGNIYIEVLMEDKAFNEKNLIILFNLLSSRFTEKPGLSVDVFTSLDAILTPEENDGLGLKGPVEDYEKFKYAFFNRNGFGEYFRYGIPGKVKDKRVVMKEPPKE